MSMPANSYSTPIPVTLLGGVFWQQFINAIDSYKSGGGPVDLSLSDGKLNPLDLFGKYPPSRTFKLGVAFVIVNKLKTPLTGVEYVQYDFQTDQDNSAPALVSYPAAIDPDTKTVSNHHQVPGMRQYPRPSLHGKGDQTNAQSWLGGVGIYRFWIDNYAVLNRGGGLAFSLKEDGSGPLVGVAYQMTQTGVQKPAVSMDLSEFNASTTREALKSLAQPPQTGGPRVMESNGKTLIGAGWASQAPTTEPVMKTLVVWIEDDPCPFDPDDPEDPSNFDPFGSGR